MECVEINAAEAREIACRREKEISMPERWQGMMKEIRIAASAGYYSLVTISELDIIGELIKIGYSVKHPPNIGWGIAVRVKIDW